MSATVPARARGTVMLAMNVGQNRRKNRKITITTRAMLKHRENWTSATEARMVVVRSLMGSIFIDGGTHLLMVGSTARIRSTVSMTLASGCLKTMRRTAGLVPFQPANLASSTLSRALPNELSRKGTLFFWVMINEL